MILDQHDLDLERGDMRKVCFLWVCILGTGIGAGAYANPWGGLEILEASFGHNCDGQPNFFQPPGVYQVPRGNLTQDAQVVCGGREDCLYPVGRLGDPAYGCSKEFYALWRCADGQVHQGSIPAEAYGQKFLFE